MALVNVNRKNTDQFYRYKMPKLIAKVEGKGNGIKTVIVNMVDIAKALSRPPSYPTKFFGCELGAQTQIDLKNERYIVNGSHNAEKLQEILDAFIEKFVLCPSCENPETNLAVHKSERIAQDCIACGHQGIINMQHRLITYIVKNPPGVDAAGTPSKKDKKERRKEKQNRQRNGETSPTHTTANHTNGTNMDTPAAKDDFDEDDWCVDTSEEAVQRRMNDLSSGVKGLAMSNDLERTQEDRFNMFYRFVEHKKKSGDSVGLDKEFVAEAERLDIKDKAILALAEVLFDQNILQQIPKYRVILLRFVNNNHKAQRYLLGAYEMLVGKSFPGQLLPKAAHILKAMYDNDLVDEEIILNWAEKISKKYVSREIASQIHEKASPFVKWLKEAEEEESSEDEDDVEIEYNTQVQKLKVESSQPQDNNADDDFDIDAI